MSHVIPTSAPVVIIGAGPAGLTAALELQARGFTDITVLEADTMVGGISRTVAHAGNRIDIGGHRFFSKSDWVMQWWLNVLPLDPAASKAGLSFQYQGAARDDLPEGPAARNADDIMLVRSRLSRIYFNRQFFDYPLKLNVDTLLKLGPQKTVVFGFSYVWAQLFARKPENSLEDFLVNRFGHKLYRQFFKEYTEKVWGVPCSEISAAWGAQRIKSLSVLSALAHAVKQALGIGAGKATQTSLIESFVYPKFGPGQMWEVAARKFQAQGGKLLMQTQAVKMDCEDGAVSAVHARAADGSAQRLSCDAVVSTMPIKDLAAALPASALPEQRNVALNLEYRDFVTVGLLYPKAALPRKLADNWIYIQEPGVKVGRVQVFNNWSPFMVAKPDDMVWMGLEFFCKDTDALWNLDDASFKALAQREMQEIGLVSAPQASDAVVLRVPKAYPGYFGEAYLAFDKLQAELDKIQNLFLVGRNGMHRYNNQDHSMLTAKEAAAQIASGQRDAAKIWGVNVDDSYHEQK